MKISLRVRGNEAIESSTDLRRSATTERELASDRFRRVISGNVSLGLALSGIVLAGFLEGVLAGMNYAFSFVLIQLLGFTLATKQPATTAPGLARRMHELRDRHIWTQSRMRSWS